LPSNPLSRQHAGFYLWIGVPFLFDGASLASTALVLLAKKRIAAINAGSMF
jgi:hypothetical protein